jgi:hypothetical protein
MSSILRNLRSCAALEYYYQSSLDASIILLMLYNIIGYMQEGRSLKNAIVNRTREVSNTNKNEKK